MSLWARAGMLAGGAAAAYMMKKDDKREGDAPPQQPSSVLTDKAKKYVPTENKSQRQMLDELDKQ